jgi:DNA repair exonuclease SbcCD ATPase subunit
MHIVRIRTKNWMCFRGEHVLDLRPGAYAVVARAEDDADRSNGSGKTALLEIVLHALEGEHRKRTEDEWITRGESSGENELTLSNGARILRSRSRGKRTTLYYFPAGGGQPAMQDEAQRLIRELVGLSADDFRATCYLGQRQTARLVLAKSEERMSVVSSWLRLAPLERCEDAARTRASALAQRLQVVDVQRAQYRESLANASEDALQDALSLADNEGARANDRVTALTEEISSNAERVVAQRASQEYDEVVAEGTRLRADYEARDVGSLEKKLAEVERRLDVARSDFQAYSRDKSTKAVLARGDFDGRCPVAEIRCPATREINAQRVRNKRLFADATERAATADAVLIEVTGESTSLAAEIQAAERIHVRLTALREQASRLKERRGGKGPQPEDPQVLRDALGKAQEALRMALERVAAAREALRLSREVRTRLEALDAEATRLGDDLATAREAVVVFGKSGAQRRVAESAMAEIEDGTNAILSACGVDLTVRVTWSREGQGLARACDACGHPYPASARAKSCDRCHAGRGPQLIHRCEFELSDQSGGLEDLAGVGLQLSAATWLRRERDIAWSTALVDEPFGALDRANRRALGSHLAAMLSGRYGFEQSFVVAHSPDVLAAMPNCVEIVRRGRNSEMRIR